MVLLRYYICCIILHLTLTGSSLVQIGDAISVKLDSSASYKHSSNIFRTENDVISDYLFIFSPGAVLNIGSFNAPLNLRLKTEYNINNYSEYDSLDIDRLKIYANGSYNPNEVLKNRFSYSNVEGMSARSDFSLEQVLTPGIVETVSEKLSFSTIYEYSPKLSFSLGAEQNEFTYDTFTDTLSSKKVRYIPFRVSYQYTDKMSIYFGATFINSEVGDRKITPDGLTQAFEPFSSQQLSQEIQLDIINGIVSSYGLLAYDTDQVYYNIGLSGNILPKLSGYIDVGYRTLEYRDNIFHEDILNTNINALPIDADGYIDFSSVDELASSPTVNSFGARSALTWTISPKFKTTINGSRDFDYAGSGSTYKFSRASINSAYKLNTDFVVNFIYGRTKKNFIIQDRDEYLTNASISLRYFQSENIRYSASFNHTKSDAVADYKLSVFTLGTNFSF